ncbi:hypothetical protein ABK040_004538 [Willaertia magna]
MKDIYSYQSDWMIYAMSWSVRKDQPFRLGIGSFIEEYCNKIEIIQLNENKDQLEKVASFEHPYPPTKIQFHPSASTNNPDLIATSGDYLRLWQINNQQGNNNQQVSKRFTFNIDNNNSEYCAPLTSFDWCEMDPNIIGTCSIDTTCTIWDIPTGKAKTQLIAHDKEVYDIAFANKLSIGNNIFCTVGADGSLRMFDLRSLEHSTILYETNDLSPLLRLNWNKQDPNLLATIAMDNSKIIILDIRVPSLPLLELSSHHLPVNGVCWAPHSSCHLCSVSDDCQALIWDISNKRTTNTSNAGNNNNNATAVGTTIDPILEYHAGYEINQVSWSNLQVDWVAIGFHHTLQVLKV